MTTPTKPLYRRRSARPGIAIALLATITIGLASRWIHMPVARLAVKEAGDILWAAAAYWAIALAFPDWPPLRVAVIATTLAVLSELSQLSHADTLQWLRTFRAGRLLLGSGFSWLDLAMYPFGAAIAWGVDRMLLRRSK